ncbi:MAG: hypothetical protein ABUK01_00005, partial [Leptospirales bacterium]
MRYFSVFLVIVCYLYSSDLNSTDYNLNSIKAKLTNNGEKIWVYKKMVKTLGNKSKCLSGETWLFKKNNQLIKNICKNKKIIRTTHLWKIYKKGIIDIIIKIDNTDYKLLFFNKPENPDQEFMKIRTITSKPNEYTKDIIF